MTDNIYNQLHLELNEQLDLINKKKMMMGYIRSTSNQHDLTKEESNKIIGALISVCTSKNHKEYEYYSENILDYIKELLTRKI
ncbi:MULTISPECIES: hypothetical protein [Bacillaceae]|uniref:hypothetical protein n=1 Tax=Bacillaceae TaxID=186817 RepID=UPI0008F96A36|nr:MULTISPECIES: hypothetical protein [Bacillaceae]GLB61790.1 hypothetical protein NCCP133_39190 [Cytobacillus sp. NCCP-133]